MDLPSREAGAVMAMTVQWVMLGLGVVAMPKRTQKLATTAPRSAHSVILRFMRLPPAAETIVRLPRGVHKFSEEFCSGAAFFLWFLASVVDTELELIFVRTGALRICKMMRGFGCDQLCISWRTIRHSPDVNS
jgi:hypothetical protein